MSKGECDPVGEKEKKRRAFGEKKIMDCMVAGGDKDRPGGLRATGGQKAYPGWARALRLYRGEACCFAIGAVLCKTWIDGRAKEKRLR